MVGAYFRVVGEGPEKSQDCPDDAHLRSPAAEQTARSFGRGDPTATGVSPLPESWTAFSGGTARTVRTERFTFEAVRGEMVQLRLAH